MEKWKCPKCENEEYEKDQFQATGGNFAKVFDILFSCISFLPFTLPERTPSVCETPSSYRDYCKLPDNPFLRPPYPSCLFFL